MTINLTPRELVYLYETLLTSAVFNSEQQEDRQSIVCKARSSLLEKLEKVSVESNKAQFQVWANREVKKVEDLAKKNTELKVAAVKSTPKKNPRKK